MGQKVIHVSWSPLQIRKMLSLTLSMRHILVFRWGLEILSTAVNTSHVCFVFKILPDMKVL